MGGGLEDEEGPAEREILREMLCVGRRDRYKDSSVYSSDECGRERRENKEGEGGRMRCRRQDPAVRGELLATF